MLSLKMKRFCSRVITSLSALGIFTIGKTDVSYASGLEYSEPHFYGEGRVVRRAVLSSKRFVSTFPALCGTGLNVASATYNSSTTSGVCTYTCASNTFFSGSTGPVTGYSVSGVTGMVLSAGAGCNLVNVVYNCGTNGVISGTTSSRTATVQAKVGSVFTVNKECVPSSAWEFDGWLGGS